MKPAALRNLIGRWALWAARAQASGQVAFHYQQVRPFDVSLKKVMFLDCSAFATWCYRRAGANDPNRRGYSGIGNTQTLAAIGKRIPRLVAGPGDLVIYSVDGPLSDQHVAVIVQRGIDPLTVSLGQEGDPSLVRVSADPRKPTFFRFDVQQTWPPTGEPFEAHPIRTVVA